MTTSSGRGASSATMAAPSEPSMRLGAPPLPGGVPNGGRGASLKSGRRDTRTWMTGMPTARALVRSFWQLAMSAAPLSGTTGRLPLMSSFCRSWSNNAEVLGLSTTSAIHHSPIVFSRHVLISGCQMGAVPEVYLLGAEFLQKTDQIVRMLFFHGENPFHQPPGRGVLVAKVIDHITVAIDSDALGH